MKMQFMETRQPISMEKMLSLPGTTEISARQECPACEPHRVGSARCQQGRVGGAPEPEGLPCRAAADKIHVVPLLITRFRGTLCVFMRTYSGVCRLICIGQKLY